MLVDYKVNKQTNEKIQKSIVNFFLNLQNKTKKMQQKRKVNIKTTNNKKTKKLIKMIQVTNMK